MDLKWDTIRIVKQLKATDQLLYSFTYSHCQAIACQCDKINSLFREYTDHSSNHSLAVLKNGDSLLRGIKLNSWEIALFIFACYMHDVGMLCDSTERASIEVTDEFQQLSIYLRDQIVSMNRIIQPNDALINEFIFLEYIRQKHSIRSAQWVQKEYGDRYVQIEEKKEHFSGFWRIVSSLCQSHGMSLDQLIAPEFRINYQLSRDTIINSLFLACLLRLADYCDFSRERALPYVRDSILFESAKSEDIWREYATVEGVVFEKGKPYISVHATCTSAPIQYAVLSQIKALNIELQEQQIVLTKEHSNYQYSYYYVLDGEVKTSSSANYIYSRYGFRVNYEKIVELLIGSKLYRNKLFALREAIQNSLDSLSVFKLKDHNHAGYIMLDFKDIDGKPVVDIFDNGTGMDLSTCEQYFLSIASSSYWYSYECHKAWGDIKNTSIIASHGIGVLSYFLIGNRIEVFSKPQDKDAIHMDIIGYKRNVVFRKTDIRSYPQIGVQTDVTTPWNVGHGTCIRIWLWESISLADIIKFMGMYILRTSHQIKVIHYGSIMPLVLPVWHYSQLILDKMTTNLYSSSQVFPFDEEKDETSQLIDSLYSSESDFFDAPPKDNGWRREIHRDGIDGIVYISPYQEKIYFDRVTQNGIWVEDAGTSIYELSDTPLELSASFTCDLNLSHTLMLDLDAERCKILDTPANRKKCKKIACILLSVFVQCIATIKNTLYFQCGGIWYHGLNTLGNEDTSVLHIYFHKALNGLLPVINAFDHLPVTNALMRAKIYNVFTQNTNTSISAKDIHAEEYFILMSTTHTSFGGSDEIISKHLDAESLRSIQKIISPKRSSPDESFPEMIDSLIQFTSHASRPVILIPFYSDPFLFPLLDCISLEIHQVHEFFIAFSYQLATDGQYHKNLALLAAGMKHAPDNS